MQTDLDLVLLKQWKWMAEKQLEIYPEESFDRILVDAPCSGLGVMKRKPDIKYTKSEKDFASLKPIQMNLLE